LGAAKKQRLHQSFKGQIMAITAAQVKELREITGCGMMDCKNVLVEVDGDMEKAIDSLRKKGMAKADKKAGRIAAEGVVMIKANDHDAVMLEINSETDFVARDENFKSFVEKISDAALKNKVDTIEKLNAVMVDGKTIEELRKALIAKIGENVNIRRIARVETSGHVGAYLHGTKIGVLVVTNGGDEALAKDIAMHIAASKPQFVLPEQVSAELIAKEKEIFVAQAKDSGKPDNIIEKMVEGRIKKFLNEVSLIGQPFVKNPDQTISDLLKTSKANVDAFVRYELGEGIEKESVDFAKEVMAQIS
jgi:elongation factor Ts